MMDPTMVPGTSYGRTTPRTPGFWILVIASALILIAIIIGVVYFVRAKIAAENLQSTAETGTPVLTPAEQEHLDTLTALGAPSASSTSYQPTAAQQAAGEATLDSLNKPAPAESAGTGSSSPTAGGQTGIDILNQLNQQH